MIAIVCCLFTVLNGCKEEGVSHDFSGLIPVSHDSINRLNDSLRIVLRNDVIENLKGDWVIDSLEIQFQNSYNQKQAGISSDTTFLNFGEITFGSWTLTQTDSDSTNFMNECKLLFNNKEYPISFDYLLYIPINYFIYSYTRDRYENADDWNSSDTWFLKNVGILDNMQIQKINEDEFRLIGINRGVKNMKLRRK
jgi:hypothetical protein